MIMPAEEFLKQGDVNAALQQLQEQVKAQPTKVEYRIFLFQLLAVKGQWDRALTQLDVAASLDDATLAMVSMYRQVIACERFREAVFLGEKDPIVFGHPDEWVALLVQALKLTAQGHYAKAQDLRAQAFELAPGCSGTLDDQPFDWLADSDARLGPVIEVIIEGRYLWVPQGHIKSIVIETPADLRDVIWLPTHFDWSNGGGSYGLIPARYPASYQSSDPLLALSRKTEWKDCGDELFLGFGQKIWVTESAECPVMDVRTIHFNLPEESTAGQSGG